MKRRVLKEVWSFAQIVLGASIMGLCYNLFLLPFDIVPGGVGGVAMVLNHLIGTPVGTAIIILNIPLFVVGVRVLGASYGLKSMVGMFVSSALIDLFTYAFPLEPATTNPLLACIFGGVMLGIGLGLVFRGGGSTGGSDIVGQVISHYSDLSTGKAILMVNFVVISLAGFGYGRLEAALYGYVNLYLSTSTIDLVLEGQSYTRAVWIVSDETDTISKAILERMGRGATLLQATGAYTNARRDVIFAVMGKREVLLVREIARDINPKAFIIITDVYEVLGEGFRPRH